MGLSGRNTPDRCTNMRSSSLSFIYKMGLSLASLVSEWNFDGTGEICTSCAVLVGEG